jgi:hypothetical protein
MVDALRAFIVARTIRNLRGQKAQHASMLVNASRFTGVQNLLRNRLIEQLRIIEDAVRVNGARPDADHNPVIAALRDCWAKGIQQRVARLVGNTGSPFASGGVRDSDLGQQGLAWQP